MWLSDDGKLSRKYIYRYSVTGDLVQQVLYKYDDAGSILEKWSTIFDDNGNVVETSCFDSEGHTIGGPIRYRYSEDGDEIEATTVSLKGDLYSTATYYYDFDAYRNWIRRLEVFKTSESGFETRVMTYRTLEYYSFIVDLSSRPMVRRGIS